MSISDTTCAWNNILRVHGNAENANQLVNNFGDVHYLEHARNRGEKMPVLSARLASNYSLASKLFSATDQSVGND